ncbi:MAG TPA: methyltransferase domain-containing protein [Acidobacteriota bacterium]|nr:methyltransferase domain-containing protein [Acidobacteriota bacterium]
MPSLKRQMLNAVNRALGFTGIELQRTSADPKAESLPYYTSQAAKAGMDINDWLEKYEDWGNAESLLKAEVFPLIQTTSNVCELGPGTGRFSRHLAKYLSDGKLHLIDHSPWLEKFLRNYFKDAPNVFIYRGTGHSIPFEDSTFDLILASGVFIELSLQLIYCYSQEFYRTLKSGGYVIMDYFDISTEDGWKHLKKMQFGPHSGFTYHTTETIDRIFISAGFEVIKRRFTGASTYIILRKLS